MNINKKRYVSIVNSIKIPTMKYQLSDIENILFNSFVPCLSDYTKETIAFLNAHVSDTEPIPNSNSKPMKSSKKPNYIHKKDLASTWIQPKTEFKTTKIDVKDGYEKELNMIRSNMNRLTSSNVSTQIPIICGDIDRFLQEFPDEKQHLFKLVFDIISMNKYLVKPNALLMRECVLQIPEFLDHIHTHYDAYLNSIYSIEPVDQNIDYNKYCEFIKVNDKRKTFSSFFTELFVHTILTHERFSHIIQFFMDTTRANIDVENKSVMIEELTENIYLIISILKPHWQTLPEEWSTSICQQIKEISLLKSKEHVSLSNRVVFKYMDINDLIVKQ